MDKLGIVYALLGAALAVLLAGAGSALGVGVSRSGSIRGCIRRPKLNCKSIDYAAASRYTGNLRIVGFGFITLSKVGLLGGGIKEVSVATGLLILAACLPIGIVGLISGNLRVKQLQQQSELWQRNRNSLVKQCFSQRWLRHMQF